MRRSSRALMAVLAVGSVAVAGCAGSGNAPEAPAGEASEGKSQSASQGGAIQFRSWSPIAQTADAMIEATQAKQAGVEIQAEIFNYPEYLVDLNTRASSGTMPDIVGLQPGALTQQYRSNLMPLNDCAAKAWGDDWESKFHEIGLTQAKMGNPEGDDNYYALPLLVQTVNLWQNVELMEEVGVEAPATWDDLVSASKAIKDQGKAGFLLPAKDAWVRNVVYLQIANNLAPGAPEAAERGEAKWTDKELVEAFGYFERLFSDGIAQDGALALDAYPNGANMFEAGDAAMIPLGAWWIQQSDPAKTDAPPLSQGLVGFEPFLFPTIPGGSGEPQLVGGIDVALGISADSKSPDVACDVLTDWIAGDGAQVLINTFNDLPAVKDVNPEKFTSDHQEEVWNLMLNEWMPNVKYSRYMQTPEMDQALGDNLAALAAGEKSPEEAAAAIQAVQDEILNK